MVVYTPIVYNYNMMFIQILFSIKYYFIVSKKD